MELTRNDLDLGMVAHDLDAMLHFYGEVLGFPTSGSMKVPGGILHKFHVGTNLLKILEVPERPPANPHGMPWEASGMRYWTVHVADLAGLMADLEAKGVTSTTGILDPRPGVRYALISDPDGNGIELVEGA